MMSVATKDVHLVVRIPLVSKVKGRMINTIKAHNDVVDRLGLVTVAKFGKPGTAKLVERLNEKIGRACLILVAKENGRFLGFQSRLSSMHRGSPTPEMISASPAYYGDIGETAGLWFTARDPFTECDLASLRLSSNQRPLLDVLRECRTSSMLIERTR
jgi:hypothetical protein